MQNWNGLSSTSREATIELKPSAGKAEEGLLPDSHEDDDDDGEGGRGRGREVREREREREKERLVILVK
jgi:hypothetical protein